MSLLGAVLGSPLIILGLIAWAILHRFHVGSYWAFALVGLAAGGTMGLIFAGAIDFITWGYVRVFSASGVLTGLVVWLIAYGGAAQSQLPTASKVS
jgi:hypothetical protein